MMEMCVNEKDEWGWRWMWKGDECGWKMKRFKNLNEEWVYWDLYRKWKKKISSEEI